MYKPKTDPVQNEPRTAICIHNLPNLLQYCTISNTDMSFIETDITLVYSIVLGVIILILGCLRCSVHLVRKYNHILRKCITYNYIGIHYNVVILSWLQLIMIALCLALLINVLVLNIKDTKGFLQRSGHLMTIHSILLTLGAHNSPLLNILGFQEHHIPPCHRWLGRATIGIGFAHVIAALVKNKPRLDNLKDICGVTVSVAQQVWKYHTDM